MTITYLFFSLLLGIRHGIDPDHLAIINGINLNNHTQGKSSQWNGFFFSLGHGVTVTLIGILIILFKNGSQSYAKLVQYTEWIPIILLLITGFYGIYILMNKSKKNAHQHRHNKLISFLTNTNYPYLNLFLTGLFFALIFDTSSQVAAWALIGEGNTQNLFTNSILIGLSFTTGMMITDTLNGLFFYRILSENNTKFNLKRPLSWVIIISSLAIGGVQLSEKIGFTIEITDAFKLVWGSFIMSATILGIIMNWYFTKKKLDRT